MEQEETFFCKQCTIEKPKTSFTKFKKNNRILYRNTCKKCLCENQKKKYWENPEKFKAKAREYRRLDPDKYNKKWNAWHKNERLKYPVRLLLRRAKRRARELSLEYNLIESDIVIPEKCPILGIELKAGCSLNNLPTDNSISLDRVDNTLGYVKGNVIVVSMRANRIKNNSTFEDIEKLYFFLKKLKEQT